MLDGEKKAIEILTSYKKHILMGEQFSYSVIDVPWAIQCLLDLYNKEKEKNKELEDTLKQTQDSWYKDTKIIEKLKKYQEGYKLLSCSLGNYINKDKIKAKIEEYENKRDKAPITSVEYDIYIYIIEVLQSLLEKE